MSALIVCPRCSAQFTHARVAPGEETICPSCGLAMQLQATGTAIVAVPAAASGDFPREPEPFDSGGQPQYRRIEWRGTSNGSPCCLLGCLLIFAFFALALRGCLSLFEG